MMLTGNATQIERLIQFIALQSIALRYRLQDYSTDLISLANLGPNFPHPPILLNSIIPAVFDKQPQITKPLTNNILHLLPLRYAHSLQQSPLAGPPYLFLPQGKSQSLTSLRNNGRSTSKVMLF